MNHLRTDYLIGGDLPASLLTATPSVDYANDRRSLGSEEIGYIAVAAIFTLAIMYQCIGANHVEHDS